MLLVSLVLIFVIIASYYYARRQDFSVGDIAPYDITSPSTQAYFNRIKTEELRQKAEEKVSIIYRKNPLIIDAILDELSVFKLNTQVERLNRIKSEDEKVMELMKHLGESQEARETSLFLVQTDERILNEIFDLSADIMSDLLNKGILEDDLENISVIVERLLGEKNIEDSLKLPVNVIVSQKIRPNMEIDEVATNRQREEARQRIVPVRETIIQNEVLVEKGSRISQDEYEKLLAVGRVSETRFWHDLFKAFVFSILLLFLVLLLLLHMVQMNRFDLSKQWKELVFLFSLIVGFVFLTRIIAPIDQFYIPVLIFPILIRVFIPSKISYYYVMVVISIVLVVFNVDYALIVAYLLASFTATVFYSRFKTVTDYIIKGVYSSLTLALISFFFLFYFPETTLYQEAMLINGIIFSNGLIASLLSLGLIVLLGHVADFITPLRLSELSDPNSPLLRKLFEIAPGTYQHSIMIANLASHAAEAIGADPMIARVGSYYHDIGKTVSPMSFTENNEGKNLLDELSPIDATKVIKSHVVQGVVLAKKYKLPSFIHSFITTHHGDNRISFLFESARKANKKIKNDKFFRYPGPKPETKEESIVMLADSIEAAARSLEEKTPENLEKLVQDLIDGKIKNCQLDESRLTYKDLHKIKKSFLATLDSLYHVRTAYPSAQKEKEETVED